MATKYTSDSHESGIPTLTEIVADNEPKKSPQPKPASTPAPTHAAPAVEEFAGIQVPPKFDKTLEKLIYKKLHQQLLALSQGLTAEVIAELQKLPQQTGKTVKKSGKNGD